MFLVPLGYRLGIRGGTLKLPRKDKLYALIEGPGSTTRPTVQSASPHKVGEDLARAMSELCEMSAWRSNKDVHNNKKRKTICWSLQYHDSSGGGIVSATQLIESHGSGP
jgi:hypothetical protein